MASSRREAFEELCRDEYARVVRTAYLITGDREEAADVAQEAFMRAYERWTTVSKLDRPGAWVQRVAVNLAISSRRRQRVRRMTLSGGQPQTDSVEARDLDLLAALKSLPPAQRAAVVLRFYGDHSVREIARALGKREGTIRALTAQGVSTLRRSLGSGKVQDEHRA